MICVVQYVGIQYENDISTEVLNQTAFITTKPEHSQEAMDEHEDHVKKIDIRYNRTKNAMEAKKVVLERLAKVDMTLLDLPVHRLNWPS